MLVLCKTKALDGGCSDVSTGSRSSIDKSIDEMIKLIDETVEDNKQRLESQN